MRQVLASDSSLLVLFGDAAEVPFHDQVLRLFAALSRARDSRIRNLHPSYSSLLVDFDPLRIEVHELETMVSSALRESSLEVWAGREVEIPVCYEQELGPDLDFVAQHCHMTTEEVIRLHSAARYQVSFLGFAPGFAYLSGLPAELVAPRHSTPRRHVPAGSVGIAGTQTGVYPLDSPGGWQIIGRTPSRLFDSTRSNPTLLLAGDTVRFVPIDRCEFRRLNSTGSAERLS